MTDEPHEDERGDDERRVLLAGLLVALVTVVPYAQTLGFELTYDDHWHIEQNELVQDLGNAVELLPWRYMDQEVPDQGRPVLLASHFVDLALGGGAAAARHAQSVVWHVFVSLLVLALGRRLGLSLRASTAAAALFGVHPAHAEAVAGVSNREDVLATFFVLATILAAYRFLSSGRWRWALATAGLHALALGSKEVAVVAPLLLGLLIVCLPGLRPAAGRARRVYAGLAAAFVVVTAGWGAFQLQLGYPSLLPGSGGSRLEQAGLERPLDQAELERPLELASAAAPRSSPALAQAWRQAREPQGEPRAERSPPPPAAPRRPQGEVRTVDTLSLQAFRAYQLLVPWPLSPEYDLQPFQRPWAQGLGALLLAALLAVAAWAHRRGRPVLAVGIGWFFVATLPVAAPTLLINPLADRYLYLPAVGSSLLLGWATADALPARRRPRLGIGLAAALALIFAVVGVRQVGIWRDDVTLFTHAVRHAPRSARTHVNLGAAYLDEGDIESARRGFERALALDSGLHAARHNLGLVAERQGRPEEAIRHYREALRRRSIVAEQPLRERTLARLAPLLLRRGRSEELAAVLERELQRRPSSKVARRWQERLEGR